MFFKPKHQRLVAILAGLASLAAGLYLILNHFNDQLVFFYTPTELSLRSVPDGKNIRLGGLVAPGGIIPSPDSLTTRFTLTDNNKTVTVSYTGILPNLFKEGQGVVAEGQFDASGIFVATSLLTKHDETYMPPELVQSIKHSGHWKSP